ncbi:MAG: DSD1 family PLP-dependent enzyme [Bryobacteraceae bacterium]|nr:DSD1 family PLP-dependent enzyme [Bryobacteraceae bacterium]
MAGLPTKFSLPTPALLLDLDAFETNLRRMQERVCAAGKALRPHAKAHKCVEIARRQIALGANGVCVATVGEAEMMAAAGITNLLFTSPAADAAKMARIAATGAMVVVDHQDQVAMYSACGVKLEVLVDVDVGDHRTGAIPGEQVLAIAHAIECAPNLTLRGLQAYSVHGSHAGEYAARKQVSEAAFAAVLETRHRMWREGLCADILTGGSTGTWEIDTALEEVTEIQAGSYALMDLAYRRIGLDFSHALTVLTTVISANHAGFVTVDGGFKAFSTDRGYGPEAAQLAGATYKWGGDEFGYLHFDDPARLARLGEKIEFIPPHCDPTVNLYDRIYACRGENVEDVWPVMGRLR